MDEVYYEVISNKGSSSPFVISQRFADITYVNVKMLCIKAYRLPAMNLVEPVVTLHAPELRKAWPLPVDASASGVFIRGDKYYDMEYIFKPCLHAFNRIDFHICDKDGIPLSTSCLTDSKDEYVACILEIKCEDVRLQ